MKQKMIVYEKLIKLKYYPSKFDQKRNAYLGWIPTPKYLSELTVISWKNIGGSKSSQVQIRWTKKAMRELWKYLIALSDFKTNDPDYHDHFDEIDNLQWDSELIIHLQK